LVKQQQPLLLLAADSPIMCRCTDRHRTARSRRFGQKLFITAV
jgi:hypothetical protein